MSKYTVRVVTIVVCVLLALATTAAVVANGDIKDYPEGQAAAVSEEFEPADALPARPIEGSAGEEAPQGPVPPSGRDYPEGTAGTESGPSAPEGIEAPQIKYLMSGVADDGAKGGPSRKKATSIHCTNLSGANAAIQVKLYQFDGTNIHTSGVTAGPMQTFTFSTQGTTIYFDDVIFGSGGGTDAIYQGFAQVLSDAPTIVCTGQVLDPLGYPPAFVSAIEIFRP